MPRASVSHLEKLKGAKNRKELAKLLGFKPSALTSIIYQTPLALKYTTFDIPKKTGGSRTINSPLKKALLTGFHSTAKHNATKAVSPSSETMRTI